MLYNIGGKTTEFIYDEKTKNISAIKNLSSMENICSSGKQYIIVRTSSAVSDPYMLTKVSDVKQNENGLQINFSDGDETCFADLNIFSEENRIKFTLKVSSPDPVWLAEWKISGFNFNEVIIPALGGQSLSSNMPAGTTLSYKYPFWWNAQFAIGTYSNGTFLLSTEDTVPDLKLLRIHKDKNSFGISLGFEAPAPLKSSNLEAEWYIENFDGDWRFAVDSYRNWMEKSFDVKNYKEHPGFPPGVIK